MNKKRNLYFLLEAGSKVFYIYVYIYIYINLTKVFTFGCAGSSLLLCGFSLVSESRVYSSMQCTGFSLQCFSHCGARL